MEFKIIESHPDFEIAKDGTIRRILSGRVMSKYKTTTGYYAMRFYSSSHVYKDVYIHILLGKAFIKNDNLLKNCINHKDGNKLNNELSNIEWCTKAENLAHALSTGLRVSARGEKSGRSKFMPNDIIKIRELINNGMTNTQIANIYNVAPNSIRCIKLKKSWVHV